MAVVEEILVRLTGENDDLKQKLAESRAELDRLKAGFPIQAQTDELLGELDDLDRSLDRTEQVLDQVKTAAGGASDGFEKASSSGAELGRTSAAIAVGLFALRQELESISRIGDAVANIIPPETAEDVNREFELIKRGFSGPISFIVTNIERATNSWSDFLDEVGTTETRLSPALEKLITDGESVQQIFLALFEEIEKQGPALERQSDALLAVSNRLRSTGQETQITNAELGAQARALAAQYDELGVSAPRALQRVIDRTQGAVDVVDDLVAAEKRLEEQQRANVKALEDQARQIERDSERRLAAVTAFTEALGLNRESLLERASIATEAAGRIIDSENLTTVGATRLREEVESIAAEFKILGEEAPEGLKAVIDQLEPAFDLAKDLAERIEFLNEVIQRRQDAARPDEAGSGDEADRVEDLTRKQARLREEVERLNKANEQGLDPTELEDLFKAQDALRDVTNELTTAQRESTSAAEDQAIAFGPLITQEEALAEATRAATALQELYSGALEEGSGELDKFRSAAAGAEIEVERLADGTFRVSNSVDETSVKVEKLADGTFRLSDATDDAAIKVERLEDGTVKLSNATDGVVTSFDQLAETGPTAVKTVREEVVLTIPVVTTLNTKLAVTLETLRAIQDLQDGGGGEGEGL